MAKRRQEKLDDYTAGPCTKPGFQCHTAGHSSVLRRVCMNAGSPALSCLHPKEHDNNQATPALVLLNWLTSRARFMWLTCILLAFHFLCRSHAQASGLEAEASPRSLILDGELDKSVRHPQQNETA